VVSKDAVWHCTTPADTYPTLLPYFRQHTAVMWSGRFVCNSFILSVCRITAKVISQFHWNLSLQIGKKWLTFGGDAVPDMDSKAALFHIPHHCGIGDFVGFLSISHTGTNRFSWHSAKWLDADNVMNQQHVGSDLADTRINLQIRIRIPDHYWLTLDALAEVCTLYARL